MSTDSAEAPNNPINTPSTKKVSLNKTTKATGPEFSNFKIPAPPKTPAGTINSKVKYQREDEQDEERVKLASKINEYLEDDLLGPKFEGKIKKPNPEAKVAELRIIKANIEAILKKGRKSDFVEGAFKSALMATEQMCVQFLNRPTMVGAADRIVQRMGPNLQADLRILSIELDDTYIPGPLVTLGMTILSEFNREISKTE